MSDYTGSTFVSIPVQEEIDTTNEQLATTNANLTQEIYDRGAADIILQNQINGAATEGALTNEITARVDGDTALGVLISDNTNLIGTTRAELTQEITDRQNADINLQNQINPLATQVSLNNEITARTDADTALGVLITDNTNLLGTTRAELTQEITDRQTADTGLQNQINDRALTLSLTAEITARTDGDSALQSQLTYEANSRINADIVLQTDINTRALQTDLVAEASARQSADTGLQGQITTNATAITTEESARQSADTGLQGQITTNATAITTEESARQAADTALQTTKANLNGGNTFTDDQVVDNIIVNTAIKSAQNAGLEFSVNSGGTAITAMKLLSNGTVEMEGKTSFKQGIIGNISQSLTAGTRLIDSVRLITKLDTRAGNMVCTISNGTADGQIKIISLHRADPQYTATLLTNVSEPLTFKNIGEGCILAWSGNTADWSVVAKNLSFLNNDLEVDGDVNLSTGHEFKVNGVPISGGMTPAQEAELTNNTSRLDDLYDSTAVTLRNIDFVASDFNCRINSLEYVEDAMAIGQIPQNRIFELNDDLDLKRSLTNNLFQQLNLNGTIESKTSSGGTINPNDYFCKFDLTGQTAELVVGIDETNVPYQTKIIFIDVEGTANLVIRSSNIMGSQDIILRKRGDCVFLHADWVSSKWKVIGIHTNVQPTLNTAGNITSGNDIICTRNLFSNSAVNTEIDGFTTINLRSLAGVTPNINIDGVEAFMTKATDQTITGVKTFENGIITDEVVTESTHNLLLKTADTGDNVIIDNGSTVGFTQTSTKTSLNRALNIPYASVPLGTSTANKSPPTGSSSGDVYRDNANGLFIVP